MKFKNDHWTATQSVSPEAPALLVRGNVLKSSAPELVLFRDPNPGDSILHLQVKLSPHADDGDYPIASFGSKEIDFTVPGITAFKAVTIRYYNTVTTVLVS